MFDLAFRVQIWAGPLSGQRTVIVLWNRCSKAATITAKWDTMGLESSTSVSVRDLWKVDKATLCDQIHHHNHFSPINSLLFVGACSMSTFLWAPRTRLVLKWSHTPLKCTFWPRLQLLPLQLNWKRKMIFCFLYEDSTFFFLLVWYALPQSHKVLLVEWR